MLPVADLSMPEYRAAGTDLTERRRSGVSRGPIRDIAPTAVPAGVRPETDGGMRVGALTTIAALAADDAIRAAYPGLAAAAAGLATPQIRRVATIGGNIAQRNRCWYFRNPEIACLKKGGDDCPARAGNALYAVAFDSAPCVAPHPSTLAAALVAYDARLDTDRRRGPADRRGFGRWASDIGRDGVGAGGTHHRRRAAASDPRRARRLQPRHRPRSFGVAASRTRRQRDVRSRRIRAASARCRRRRAGSAAAARGGSGRSPQTGLAPKRSPQRRPRRPRARTRCRNRATSSICCKALCATFWRQQRRGADDPGDPARGRSVANVVSRFVLRRSRHYVFGQFRPFLVVMSPARSYRRRPRGGTRPQFHNAA